MVPVTLNVITCCIRPNNLQKIADSFKVSNKVNIPINWYLVLDNKLKYSESQIRQIRENLTLDVQTTLEVLVFSQSLLQNSPVNLALDQIKTGLVCLIDDDNIMHPEYITDIYELAKDKMEIGILSQQNLGREYKSYNRNIRHVFSYQVAPGCVDTAQLTISRSLIGNLRWTPIGKGTDVYHRMMSPKTLHPIGEPYRPDGVFISTLYQQHRDKFFILNKPLCYYNYLSSNLDFS